MPYPAVSKMEKRKAHNMNYQDGVFERRVRIAYYECGLKNKLKLSNILRHTQEIASRHMDVQGYPFSKLEEMGTIFLLSRLAVKILDIPKAGDELIERTWAKGTKGAYFLRDCVFNDLQGNKKVEIATMWILVDPNSHMVLKPSSLKFCIDLRPDLSTEVEAKRKMILEDPVYYGSRKVRISDIDCNDHINNAVYADISCDFAQNNLREQDIREFVIHFVHEGKLGDTVAIFGTQEVGGTQNILGKVQENICFEASIVL